MPQATAEPPRKLQRTPPMLFMVIETMKAGPAAVGERFRACGRMMPDTIAYVASWVEPDGSRCFQLMEAPSREALQPWIDRWSDLVDFDVRAVQPSAEFWAEFSQRAAH